MLMNHNSENDHDYDNNDSIKHKYLKDFISSFLHNCSNDFPRYHQSILISVEILLSQGDVVSAKYLLEDNMRILSHLNSQYLCYLHIILASAQLIEIATMIDRSLILCGDTSLLHPFNQSSSPATTFASSTNNNHHNNNAQHSTAAAARTLCPSMEDVVRDPLLFSRCVSIVHLVSMCSATSMTINHTSTNYNDDGDDDNDISASAPSTSSKHYHKYTHNSHFTGNSNHNSSEFYLQEISSYRQQCRDIIKELQLHFHKYISTFNSNSSNSNNGRNGRRRQHHRGKRKKNRNNNNGVVGSDSISRLDLVALYTAFLVGCNKRNKVSVYTVSTLDMIENYYVNIILDAL
jgi:hypothetical protein